MYDKLLESSEFYQRRYHNFSSLLIVPTALLFGFILLFMLFAKKEITISAVATIEPSRILTNIQSTSNNIIVKNNLTENQVVHRGDLLISYQSLSERIQKDTYQNQTDLLYDQRSKLEMLKASLETGYNQLVGVDSYGYNQRFEDYINQVASLSSNASQQNATIISQNDASQRTKAELEGLIAATEQKVWDYQALKYAIEQNTYVAPDHIGYYVYVNYLEQLDKISSEAERVVIYNQTLAQVDSLIAQHSSELANYKLQHAGSGVQQATGSVDSQILALKSQKLAEVGLELATIDQRILESEGGLKLQHQNLSKTEIRASQEGVVHLNAEVEKSTIIPEGTIIAQLYPIISKEKSVKIVTYIPSRDISSIKVGDTIRFITEDTSNNKVTVTSKISSIASAATTTENGNFFKVEADTALKVPEIEQVKYGLEGRFIMITGQKTYWDYYKDKLLGQD